MKAVMYHYVRPSTTPPPYEYYHLSLSDFNRQLDYFEDNYELIDRGQFIDYLRGDRRPNDEEIVLTFDDGLRDQYEWVFPELERRGLWGVFFVPSGPLSRGEVLAVHRVHTLLGKYESEELLSTLMDILREKKGIREKCGGLEEGLEDYDSEGSIARFKQLLNFIIPYEHLNSILDKLEAEFPKESDIRANEYYLSTENIRELQEAGMLLGAHSVTHRVLSRISRDEQRREISQSIAFLEKTIGDVPATLFAYPYGGPETYTETTKDLTLQAGSDWAFTTEPGNISSGTIAETPMTLPRHDCNEFPFGGASGNVR